MSRIYPHKDDGPRTQTGFRYGRQLIGCDSTAMKIRGLPTGEGEAVMFTWQKRYFLEVTLCFLQNDESLSTDGREVGAWCAKVLMCRSTVDEKCCCSRKRTYEANFNQSLFSS